MYQSETELGYDCVNLFKSERSDRVLMTPRLFPIERNDLIT